MKKDEVELIIVGINLGKEEILKMKIYKDGTLCRRGCGGMPTFSISGMTLEGEKKYWDKLITLIDEKIVETPINYQEESIKNPLEYFIVFYGASDNGETGERANWTKTSGIRFLLDNDTSFRHPLLGFLDGFAIQSAEVTNEWFFDIVMAAVYDLKPLNLEGTFVTAPKTEGEKQEALSRYVNQIMTNSPRGWDIVKIGNGRKYKNNDGKELTSSVVNNAGQVSINFKEIFGINDIEAANKSLMDILDEENKASNSSKEIAKKDKPTTKNFEKKTSKNWWEFWK
ncbi:MAG: hypothetical protein AB8F94_21900 [Saprospiraceae bacterium]